MKRWLIAVAGLVSVMIMVAACAPPLEKAMTPEEFYRSQVTTLMCTSLPGGGYDLWMRTIAPFLAKELGVRDMRVDNKSGGAGYPGTNWLYNSAPRDGSVFGIIQGEKLAFNELYNLGEAVEFKDFTSFSVIATWGSTDPTGADTVLVSCTDRPWNSLLELKAVKGLTTDTTAIWTSSTFGSLDNIFGLGLEDAFMVGGYPGSAEAKLAVFRGEVDFGSMSITNQGTMLQGGMVKILGGSGTVRPDFCRDLPCKAEVREPGTEKWKLYAAACSAMLRYMVGPPGIPEDRLEFVRQAFTRVTQDPEFLKILEQRAMYFYDCKIGQDALDVFYVFTKLPQSELDYIKNTIYTLLK